MRIPRVLNIDLHQSRFARFWIKACRSKHPDFWNKGYVCAQLIDSLSISYPKFKFSLRIDAKPISLGLIDIPRPHYCLSRLSRQGRPNKRKDTESTLWRQYPIVILNPCKGSVLRILPFYGDRFWQIGRNGFLNETWSFGIIIPMYQTNNFQCCLFRAFGRKFKIHRFS